MDGPESDSTPSVVRGAVGIWLVRHDELAPGLIKGLYLVGSTALDDYQPRSDIDIVAFLSAPPNDAEAELLRAAHLAAVADLSGTRVDGPYLAWGDVSDPPAALRRPWTLDGEFHHNTECFEINPITWYVLATHGIAVRGPDPVDLGVALDAGERTAFVRDNADTYWRSVAEATAAAAADPSRSTFDAAIIEWCILGVARMLFTFRSGDVASKSGAGRWLSSQLPEYGPLVDQVLESRSSPDPPPPVDHDTATSTAQLMAHIIDLIA